MRRSTLLLVAVLAIGQAWRTTAHSQTASEPAQAPETLAPPETVQNATKPTAVGGGIVPVPTAVIRTDDLDLEKRRERLEAMSADEKAKLLAKKDRFDQLAPEEQTRLREMHLAIAQHPNRDQLEQVLENYTNWLAKLSQNERFEVQSLQDSDEKLSQINKLRSRQEDLRLARVGLTKGDAQTTWEWFDRMLKVHHEAVIEETRDGTRAGDQHYQFLAGFVCSNARAMNALQTALTREDKDQLLQRLSESAVDRYAATPNSDQQKLVADWIHESARSQFQQVSEEQIKRRLSRLPEEERERYLAMPRHKIFEELRRREQMRAPRGRGWRPNGGPRPGGGFGFPNGRGKSDRPEPPDRSGPPDQPEPPDGAGLSAPPPLEDGPPPPAPESN